MHLLIFSDPQSQQPRKKTTREERRAKNQKREMVKVTLLTLVLSSREIQVVNFC